MLAVASAPGLDARPGDGSALPAAAPLVADASAEQTASRSHSSLASTRTERPDAGPEGLDGAGDVSHETADAHARAGLAGGRDVAGPRGS